MSISADGPITGPLEALETLLANCPDWQDWCGVSAADAARDHIFQWIIQEEDEGGAPRYPLALIRWRPRWSADCKDIGSTWWHDGRLEVAFGDLLPDEYRGTTEDNVQLASKWIAAKVEDVLLDVEALAGTDGFLYIDNLLISQGPSVPDRSQGETATDPKEVVLPVEVEWSQ